MRGNNRIEETAHAYAGADFAEIVEYIDDMRSAYAWADSVQSRRSGASTVAELAAVGKAALYVPFPAAADNHQEKNAMAMVRRGAGILIRDSELERPPLRLKTLAKLVTDRKVLEDMGKAAREQPAPTQPRKSRAKS